MSRDVFVKSESQKYAQNITIGPHVLQSDEPVEIGGNDAGPNANELLMASLGACATITVQMYAERNQWPLQRVQAALSYSKVLAENTAESGAKIAMVDQIEMEISLTGDLSDEQQRRLFDIAGRCPIHRMLVSHIQIQTKLLASGPIRHP
ncbi:OsmC family protein [Granulicella sp. L60]|uniref:OsmC family protein n=1 Tax=Granulicella sp. L60 TaxID=1641866 RepID=UPI00131E35B1|nr:OsmC family protein [Granulicella sp. L60]